MKRFFLLPLLVVLISPSYAQTEVYLSNDTSHVVSLHGIGIGTNESWNLEKTTRFTSWLEVDYFYELALNRVISVVFDVGVNTSYWKSGSISVPMFTHWDLYAGVTPRYYFALDERKSVAKGGLNSGWFLSLPLRISTELAPAKSYRQNGETIPIESQYKLPFGKYFTYSAGLNVGYRYALTNRIFIEGALGGGYQTYNFKNGLLYINVSLKAAYTF